MSVLSLRSALLLLLLLPFGALAATFEIVHVEYDPEGSDAKREWVRVQNMSAAPVDMAGWKFVEGGVNHGLKAVSGSVVPAGGYVIIASDAATYMAEHPGTRDIVFDSSFSLSNSGEALALMDTAKAIQASKTYVAIPKPIAPAKSTKAATKPKKDIPTFSDKGHVATPIAAAPAGTDWSLWPWVAGLIALVVVGGGALFLVPKSSDTGYEIIDSSDK